MKIFIMSFNQLIYYWRLIIIEVQFLSKMTKTKSTIIFESVGRVLLKKGKGNKKKVEEQKRPLFCESYFVYRLRFKFSSCECTLQVLI